MLLWVHGGGWLEGSRVGLPPPVAPHRFHQRFLDRGWAVADIDYRLALEAQYPAQLLDVQSAVRWLRLYAEQLSIDPTRFAALGESAGGHLAAMAGLTGTGDTAIQAVVNWYGAVDFFAFDDLDDPTAPPAILFGGPVSGRREFVAFGNPINRVHAGAPPFLTVHGTADQIVAVGQGAGADRGAARGRGAGRPGARARGRPLLRGLRRHRRADRAGHRLPGRGAAG